MIRVLSKRRAAAFVAHLPFLLPAVLLPLLLHGQTGAKNGEWPTYGGDLGNTRYSPLAQIDASNFNKLKIAWTFKTDNLGPFPEYKFESTPLMVKNRGPYTTAGSRRAVVALDPGTGEMLWMHREDEGARGEAAPRRLSGRGLSYWSDGSEERIFYVTPGYRLIALNAKTGTPVTTFGDGGVVDLRLNDDQTMDPISADIGFQAAPVVAGSTIVVGAAHLAGEEPKSRARCERRCPAASTRGPAGDSGSSTPSRKRGNSAAIPGKGILPTTPGIPASGPRSALMRNLALAYLPVELPTADSYGAYRPGNGLFGESIVAVDLKTGQRKWHYQLVHHGLWDFDIPCAPVLVDITVDGKPVKALAQPTKQSILYVFNRVTGKPIWPIVERPAPKGDAPGEWYATTQPIPTKPPFYGRNGFSVDDLIDFTPDLKQQALKSVSQYKLGPVFTPPVVSNAKGPIATLIIGYPFGGTNWPGGSYDPETRILYVFSEGSVGILGLVPPERGNLGYGLCGWDGPRRGGLAADRRRLADHQASLRANQCHQPRFRRDPLAGGSRRDARQDSQQPLPQGTEPSPHRPPGDHRCPHH